jgi:uncharacterized membrane protein
MAAAKRRNISSTLAGELSGRRLVRLALGGEGPGLTALGIRASHAPRALLGLGDMSGNRQQTQAEPGAFHAVLTPHRSLGPKGFLVLMVALGGMSFATGLVFVIAGAWPVMGFFGLDVLLVYVAFRLNYRSGRLYETVEVTPARLTVTRVHPSGRTEQFDCNPYWARVNLREWPDGRTILSIAAQGREHAFGRFLTDEERRDFASALKAALLEARGGVRI